MGMLINQKTCNKGGAGQIFGFSHFSDSPYSRQILGSLAMQTNWIKRHAKRAHGSNFLILLFFLLTLLPSFTEGPNLGGSVDFFWILLFFRLTLPPSLTEGPNLGCSVDFFWILLFFRLTLPPSLTEGPNSEKDPQKLHQTFLREILWREQKTTNSVFGCRMELFHEHFKSCFHTENSDAKSLGASYQQPGANVKNTKRYPKKHQALT